MNDLEKYLNYAIQPNTVKIIISNPVSKTEAIRKIVIERTNENCQISKYTKEQVFYEKEPSDSIVENCYNIVNGCYRQVNILSTSEEHIILISKKGSCNYKVKKLANDTIKGIQSTEDHNRKKKYILAEGMCIAPLVDMGIFTSEGKVVNSMYDKYKQINRFIEILDDELREYKGNEINVIDFGCGKSYLTFVVYYYLTEILNLKANVIGLDLKSDVIEKCNIAAKKYGYTRLKFCLGDINGFNAPFEVDMVITLHACDTATDYALYNALMWGAKLIFSVPCCQHELNKQIAPNSFSILSRYGIIKERFSALATDAVRGNLLEYCGYKTQLLEFIDFDHTPKNIMIRAVRRPITLKYAKEKALNEIEVLLKEFSFSPTLYNLVMNKKDRALQ